MADPARVQDLSLEIFARVRDGWRFASEIVAEIFRREADLGDEERARIVTVTRDLTRHARRLDFLIAEAGGRDALSSPRRADLARYYALEIGAGRMPWERAARTIPRVDWRALADPEALYLRVESDRRRFALRHSLPDWLGESLQDEYPGEADDLARALNEAPPRTLRANVLKVTLDGLRAALAAEGIASTPGRWAPTALRIEAFANLFRTRAFQDGLFEVQDEASQVALLAIAPPPRSFVADVCAGTGGKSLGIAAALAGKGSVLALDAATTKIDELRRRARRAGAHQVQALAVAPGAWTGEVAARVAGADRILIDAPCSGTGALRRNPEAKWVVTPEDIAHLRQVQLELVARAAALLKPAARLIYATCSILRSENEDQIVRILAAHPELEPVRLVEILGAALALPITDPTGTYLKLLPHRHGTDGFFAAVLRRRR
jgi:16S rRNA (cytosine967-C5)-methyltransferase